MGLSLIGRKCFASALIFQCIQCVDIQANILVVDQDITNQAADFQQLQPAVDAAQDGDTIYVMGSSSMYEAANVNKSLTLIGAGTFKNITFPAISSLESLMGKMTINANNVFVTGFHFAAELLVLAPSQNVTVFRNYFNSKDHEGVLEAFAVETPEIAAEIHHLHVINNIFWANSSKDEYVDLFHSTLDDKGIYTKVVGFVFANNLVWGGGQFVVPNGSVEVYNNYFNVLEIEFRETARGVGVLKASGNFYNNIIHNRNTYREGLEVRRNNAYYSGLSGTTKGYFSDSSNIQYTNLGELVALSGSVWQELVPTADSPLKGAGVNGEDIGIFGGPHAWNPNFQPPVPVITRLQTPRIVGAGENLSLQIEVQPNN